ncbi:hypothetical protein K493DRAFT_323485 [Basidiobolus meristosporus CBS 931.73]|uniref:Amino acid transporter transmembrane domain-containing protein n=1 Tax=Basidiobolus meristosporus CBS 931.73 TaxID=1314790 RepID=A0A1Y1YTE4_9FUNG|nr:hypothetical protein K493DRAFT_323485 [Basidiobolus meristosporus CBS 931.73]|eukprot:ORY01308.1 hypothetical protein K493DRAFT_323485 [Basidiobolus meristosporus CBS 931.73]
MGSDLAIDLPSKGSLDVSPTNTVVRERNGSSLGAYFNVICVVAGTGTLQLPLTLMQGGWISILLMMLCGTIAVYTGNLLIKCLYHNGQSRLPDYPSVGYAAYGRFGQNFIRSFHYTILLGASCIYIILAGVNLHELSNTDIDRKVWIAISAAIVWVPFVALKSLKEFVWLSVFGVLTTLVVILVTVVEGLRDLPNQRDNSHHFIVPAGIPIALTSIAFSFGGNAIYPHVEVAMKHPKSWNRTLAIAIFTIFLMYVLISATGYYVYGDSTMSPIYANLPHGVTTSVAIVMITVHVALAAPLNLISFSNEMEIMWSINDTCYTPLKAFCLRFALRSFILVILTIIGVFLPYFGPLMSLIGGVGYPIILFLAPIVLYLKLFGLQSMGWPERVWCILIAIIAIVGLVLGTKDAIIQLIMIRSP